MKYLKKYNEAITELKSAKKALSLHDIPAGAQVYCGHVEDGEACEYYYGEFNEGEDPTQLNGRSCPSCNTKIGWKVDLITPELAREYGIEEGWYLSDPKFDHLVKDKINLPSEGDVPEIAPKHKPIHHPDAMPKIIPGGWKRDPLGKTQTTPAPPPTPPKGPSGEPDGPFFKHYKMAFYNNTDCPPNKIFNPETGTCDPLPQRPQWVKDWKVYSIGEMVKILEKYLDPIAKLFVSCMPKATPTTIVEVTNKLKTLLRELKTGDKLRAIDACRIFYNWTLPQLSQNNIKIMLQSSDGRKWGKFIILLEYFAGLVLSIEIK